MENQVALSWHSERRRLDTLTPLENNPFGKITQEKRRRLEQKLQELGIFEAATVDTDGVLLTFNKRHNLLMGLGRGAELVEVMVPNRPLTADERKKIILASNINEGEWIDDILRADYDEVMEGMGLHLASIDALLEDTAGQVKEQKPEYPIVAEFSEKYDAFVIVCRNDIDTNFLKQVLGIETMQSYKSKETGTTHVIEASAFAAKWKSK